MNINNKNNYARPRLRLPDHVGLPDNAAHTPHPQHLFDFVQHDATQWPTNSRDRTTHSQSLRATHSVSRRRCLFFACSHIIDQTRVPTTEPATKIVGPLSFWPFDTVVKSLHCNPHKDCLTLATRFALIYLYPFPRLGPSLFRRVVSWRLVPPLSPKQCLLFFLPRCADLSPGMLRPVRAQAAAVPNVQPLLALESLSPAALLRGRRPCFVEVCNRCIQFGFLPQICNRSFLLFEISAHVLSTPPQAFYFVVLDLDRLGRAPPPFFLQRLVAAPCLHPCAPRPRTRHPPPA